MLSYSLRNSDQYQTIDTKSQLYYNSFLPSAVREWNALDSESQSCPPVPSFKRSISNRLVVPNYYFTGSRIEQILHARLKTNCSCFNYTLFSKNISSVTAGISKTHNIFSSIVLDTLLKDKSWLKRYKDTASQPWISSFLATWVKITTLITQSSKLFRSLLPTLKDLRINYWNIVLL